jgi:hypothetical protein
MFWERKKDSPKLVERVADLEVELAKTQRELTDLEAQVLKWRRLATRELKQEEPLKTAAAPSDFESWSRLRKKAWLRGRVNGRADEVPPH